MKKVNAIGDTCPVPVIKAIKALNSMVNNETLLISVDNITSTENLGKMANELGFSHSVAKLNIDHYDVSITKNEVYNEVHNIEKADSYEPIKNNTTIVISSNTMGSGNDELGVALLKAFIYTLTELERLPSTVVLYNGGAMLPIEGSNSLEDLKKLEDLGVEIMTCGACLDYYNVKDKLKVGSVTNMYSILENLNTATKIISP